MDLQHIVVEESTSIQWWVYTALVPDHRNYLSGKSSMENIEKIKESFKVETILETEDLPLGECLHSK